MTTNPLHTHTMGLGTWQWGDSFFWNYGQGYGENELQASFTTTVEAGISLFDTAEVYGLGRSEMWLGRFARTANRPTFIATKFMPFPWRLTAGAFRHALRKSLDRLGLDKVDLYQLHWPLPPIPVETWMNALAEEVRAGRARYAGVSNYSPEQTRRAHARLRQHGVPLVSNQVEFNLLNRTAEKNGLLALCRDLDVRVMAYSPLAMGLLTGKYSPENPPPGVRGRRYASLLARLAPLTAALNRVGEAHGGKTPAQVALNWCVAKGTLPIPGAKNARQAAQNAGALGWQLTPAEVAELDALSDEVTAKA